MNHTVLLALQTLSKQADDVLSAARLVRMLAEEAQAKLHPQVAATVIVAKELEEAAMAHARACREACEAAKDESERGLL